MGNGVEWKDRDRSTIVPSPIHRGPASLLLPSLGRTGSSEMNLQRVPHLVLLIRQRQVLIVHLHHQLLHLPLQPAVAELEAVPVPGRMEEAKLRALSARPHRRPGPGCAGGRAPAGAAWSTQG